MKMVRPSIYPDRLRLDRYEKRHKNLAAHVSPAFRVELGDVVTVGMYIVHLHSWGDDWTDDLVIKQ